MDEREQQVWQRVSQKPEMHWEVQGLMREASELAAVYRRLSGRLTGRGKELARALLEGELANAACLRGIAVLSGSEGETVKLWEPESENGRRMLEKCYHRTHRCQGEYMARSLDTEFGEVFRWMADQEGRQCARIAQLLGWMQKD